MLHFNRWKTYPRLTVEGRSSILGGTMSKLKKGNLKLLQLRDATFVVEYVKDFSARRAAEAVGLSPESGYEIVRRPEIMTAIEEIVTERCERMGIDAEWLLYELVDNHRIARQQGNISASNTALGVIMKHVSVDAEARKKIEMDVTTDQELLDRLRRGRERLSADDDKPSFL